MTPAYVHLLKRLASGQVGFVCGGTYRQGATPCERGRQWPLFKLRGGIPAT